MEYLPQMNKYNSTEVLNGALQKMAPNEAWRFKTFLKFHSYSHRW